MTELTPIPFNDVQKMFGDGTIYKADEELLKRCLLSAAQAPFNNEKDRQLSDQLSETIRHLLLLKQNEKTQSDSRLVAWVALTVAAVSAFASIIQAAATVLQFCRGQ